MTLVEFEKDVYAAALASNICGVPLVRRLTATAINIRINITTGDIVDVFYNEASGTTAFALIRQGKRIFGADNTGGWHVHPFHSPELHIPHASPVTPAQFLFWIEDQIKAGD